MTGTRPEAEVAPELRRDEVVGGSREAISPICAYVLQLDPATLIEFAQWFEDTMQVELSSQSTRDRRIAAAMIDARRALGRSPSRREYTALRREHPEWRLPDPRSIAGWLGVRTWNDALVRLGLKPVLGGDEIEGAIGKLYTVAQVTQAVRDCAADLGRPPTITEYLAWQMKPEVRDRPGRRPASTWVFHRMFGGFPQARVAAGLDEGEATDAHPTELLLRVPNRAVTKEQICNDIRLVAGRTSGPLTAAVYDRERHRVYLETRALGKPRVLVSVGSICRRFTNWPTALKGAGIDLTERPPIPKNRARRRVLSDDHVLSVLREAYDAVEGPLTEDRYDAWRAKQLEEHPERTGTLYSSHTIWRRFGSLGQALTAAGLQRQTIGRPGRKPFSNDHLLQAVCEAAAAAAPDRLTILRYASWREQEGIRDPDRLRVLPEHSAINRRFGGWRMVLLRMREWAESQ